jgi:hypothetical protein
MDWNGRHEEKTTLLVRFAVLVADKTNQAASAITDKSHE